jgi:CheY-like chemotaxis protein
MLTGHDLLAALTEERPDAILLELFLPDMNGWETVARIKSDPSMADIPVIISSVLSPEETGISPDDFSAWIQKPFTDETLAAALNRALQTIERDWWPRGDSNTRQTV